MELDQYELIRARILKFLTAPYRSVPLRTAPTAPSCRRKPVASAQDRLGGHSAFPKARLRGSHPHVEDQKTSLVFAVVFQNLPETRR